jgi:hypothetical protein
MVRRSRRLPATILAAAHRACDSGELDIAAKLLRLGEEVIASEADFRWRRHDMWALIAAHERLWYLRHKDLTFGDQ